MAICGRYSLKYSYVIEEPPETDSIVIGRAEQMLGICKVTYDLQEKNKYNTNIFVAIYLYI